MTVHSLIVAYDDFSLEHKALPRELRLSSVMIGWYIDRLRDNGEPTHPLRFNGIPVVHDREIDGFKFV